ncbi:hypothetical protein NDU88_012121 [Pleurodeles waltl]|uniref:VWFA domain-containing protein n=1 Tax=Pleurodeles waltl TaxID=8319 RepID=A0AAV7S386_PLEWA|nr:hypothetical protein NDU88_012121 [Pleurodeles waltl]
MYSEFCIKKQNDEKFVEKGTVFQQDGESDKEFNDLKWCCLGKAPSLENFEPECSGRKDIKADVVLIVDGSGSIHPEDFSIMRTFLEALVRSFDVSRDTVQFSLVQFSENVQIEVALNSSHNINGLLHTLQSFPQIGGGTWTGNALSFVRQRVLVKSMGARANVPRVMVLITDGESQDEVKAPALELQCLGVEVFVVGVSGAMYTELVAIVSPPADTHVFIMNNFRDLQQILPELTESICLRIQYKQKMIKHNL